MNSAVGALSYSLDTRVKGTPVVVYNAVTYPVKAVVEAEIPLAAKAKGVAVYGPDGRRVAAQILSREGDKAVIAFAADVKSVGYAVYDVRPGIARQIVGAESERQYDREWRLQVDARQERRHRVARGQALRP